MAVNLTSALTAVAVGAVDTVLEKQDADNGRTETMKQWHTWGRVGMVLLGYLQPILLPRIPIPGDTLVVAGLPLLTKTVWTGVQEMSSKKSYFNSMRPAGYVPAETGQPAAYRRVN